MTAANWLLNLYFAIDYLFGVILPQAIYVRLWSVYDRMYEAAVIIAPFDIPPIFEGVSLRAEYRYRACQS